MKYSTIIDPEREEEVLIYVHARTRLVDEIEALICQETEALIGYKDGYITQLLPKDIFAFTVEDGKIFALTEHDKWQIKERLYSLEERLSAGFLKINQSCLINRERIDCFKSSIGGALLVVLTNGFCDYIARRRLRYIKERMGI